MGTICGTFNANIFIVNFEPKHIYPSIHTLTKCLFYNFDIFKKYLFMIWKDKKATLITSIKELNKKYKTIKFDF